MRGKGKGGKGLDQGTLIIRHRSTYFARNSLEGLRRVCIE